MENNQGRFLTLNEFIILESRQYPNASGSLSSLIRDIAFCAKRIHVKVNNAGLADILSKTGSVNVQGEEVQKLDEYANQLIIQTLKNGIDCAGVASEEEEDIIIFDNEMNNQSKYVALFDPIDGSGNIDVNVSIGTIFSIYKRRTPVGFPASREDFLQAGNNVVAAGYVVYGSSTMLVYATNKGRVHGFTLDTSIGEFCLSHRNIQIPEKCKTISLNMGNFADYEKNIQHYLDDRMKHPKDKNELPAFRYVGSMIADIHRNLLKGGVFLYPPTKSKPQGKLRLLYECIPMTFIIKKAGGLGSDGVNDILDIEATTIHQRSPLIIGNASEVEAIMKF